MAILVFTSNRIESVGLSFEDTMSLCHYVFRGRRIDTEPIEEQSVEYKTALSYLQKEKQGMRKQHEVNKADVLKARREIVKHGQALHYIIDKAFNRNWSLTEKLVLDTHLILCRGIPRAGHEVEEYAGGYRSDNAPYMAGSTVFSHSSKVPECMRIWVADSNEDVRNSEQTLTIDSWFLMADLCQDFMTIHPSKDGNGRMCQLLLNAYLIKYASATVSLGKTKEAVEEYLSLARLAGDPEHEEEARGWLARMVLEKGVETLRKRKGNVLK